MLASARHKTPSQFAEAPVPQDGENRALRQTDFRPTTNTSIAARASRFAFIWASLMALAFGYWLAAEETFTPKDGFGYWIGIVGGVALLIQLAYPLRKRARFMRTLGSAPNWFRLHMILGIVGPLLILYHCNYSLGAPNSNVALIAMLTVAASGIIGRYFYGKVHNGLYGAHSNLQDLLEEATNLLRVIEIDTGGSGGAIAVKLTRYGEDVLQPSRGVFGAVGKSLRLGLTLPLTRQRMLREVHNTIALNAARQGWTPKDKRAHYVAAKAHVHSYLDAVAKASGLAFYDRLFAMWHLLHMPLYFLLILTGIIHVIAVHLY
jgi:hypothetical protein